jgi:hypothetical protein
MSEGPRVAALVCEGPTDVPVLAAIIRKLWPEIDEVLSLQPELDDTGLPAPGATTGWSSVQAWCLQRAGALAEEISPPVGSPIDLLVIALDVDIAVAAGIVDPPQVVGAYEATRLCSTLKSWLVSDARTKVPAPVVIALPSMALETWVIAALFPKQTNPETLPAPAEYLATKKKLRRRADGKPSKHLPAYRDFGKRVAANLARVRSACSEAERFCAKVERRRDVVERGNRA